MSALSHVYSDRTSRSGLRQRRLSVHRQSLAALAVSVVAGLAIFATAAGSLMQGAAPPAPKSPPPGWIDIAFAQVDADRVDAGWAATAMRQEQNRVTLPQTTQRQDTRKQDSCADFVYFFLNTSCSVKRVSSTRRDGFMRRTVAARTLPAAAKQVTARNSDLVTFAATTTTATD